MRAFGSILRRGEDWTINNELGDFEEARDEAQAKYGNIDDG